MKLRIAVIAAALSLGLSALGGAAAQTTATSSSALTAGFENPPNGARPRVWWHWMNGNISEQGIKLDLDWMHRSGLGGVTIFEGAINTPQVVPQRLIYMTPEWKQAFKYAVTTAHGLGLEVAIASSPGWSETGGPWVPAAQGMKKLVWSATRVRGGEPFSGKLAHPPQVDGTFQNYQTPGRRGPDGQIVVPPEYYGDVAVMAYKIPANDVPQADLHPHITSSSGAVHARALSDGDVNTVALSLPGGAPGSESWVQFDYGHPQTIRAVTLASLSEMISVFNHLDGSVPPRIEASDDGVHFRKISDIPLSSVAENTASFDAVTARDFRVVFTEQHGPQRPKIHEITELVLHSGARTNQWEKRAGYATEPDFYTISDPTVEPQSVVQPGDVVDLTGKMQADGTLNWTPPAGEWMVVRFGYSLTGRENHPAPAEATGLEVDKLNRADVKNYLDGYLKMYANTVGPQMLGSEGISYMLTDSIEVGAQNWTDDMLAEFQRLRGYDARPWLPALTGVVLKSTADTDRFLWDFRRTIGQLLAQSHYGEIAEELHAHGMKYYSEALEMHRPSLGDDMEMRSAADVPMGAMWTYTPESAGPVPSFLADLRGAASVAHIYGQNLVGAESMTSRGPSWGWSPGTLKRIADLEFDLGVNRFEIHESAHQPVPDMAPGLTLGPYGLWFNRNQTWAADAGAWVTYLSRCSYLLQQGRFYGDVAYFYGEEGPLTAVYGWKPATDLPQGYGFDFVNSDVLLHHLAFQDGRMVAPSGASYRVLYLGGRSQKMTLPVLKQIASFVEQGAVVIGNRPIGSPSLADNDKEFQQVADRLWGKGTPQPGTMRRAGKGRVYVGMSTDKVLAALDVQDDFAYTRPEPDTELMFVHRKLADGDIYFVDNRKDRAESLEATFRVTGKEAELWDPATGTMQPASYKIAEGHTTVPLRLDAYGSIFVVFRKAATEQERTVPTPAVADVPSLDEALNSGWTVSFQPDRGAPAEAKFASLTSWSDNADAGIKYFSGAATYTKTIDVPADTFKPGEHLWLNLGDVKDIAQVTVNGKDVGVAWKAPFKVDLSGALKPGENQIAIRVTNLWVNRLIGDEQPWSVRKYAFTDIKPYKADSPLLPSGLLGPVHIEQVSE